MIALIDYGAGNLTSVRKALDRARRRVRDARVSGGAAHAIRRSSCPASATSPRPRRSTVRGATRSDAAVRARHAAVRHLPRHAVAVRGQRRSAGRAGARRPARPRHAAPGQRRGAAEDSARRLECARFPRGPADSCRGSSRGAQVYFTHSYAAPVTADCVAATTHAETFAAVVERDNVFGVQFHPEKSSDAGLQIIRNFLEVAAPAVRARRRVLTKRIIACMDVRDGQVVKGVQFQQLRHAGDPAELARALQRRRHRRGRHPRHHRDAREAARRSRERSTRSRSEIFLPLTVGGGIRSEDDAAAAVDAGADKVSLNTAALEQSRADHDARPPLRQPGGDRRHRRQAARRRLRRLRAQRHGRCGARCGRVGARGRVARRRRDSADVDGSRRHARRIRLRDDRRGRRTP